MECTRERGRQREREGGREDRRQERERERGLTQQTTRPFVFGKGAASSAISSFTTLQDEWKI